MHFSYPDTILQKVIDSDLRKDKKYRYSDLGYYFFHKIIEDHYNDDLDQILDDNIYKKLGMQYLGYLPKERFSKHQIVPTEYDYIFRSQLVHGDVHDMGAAMFGGFYKSKLSA